MCVVKCDLMAEEFDYAWAYQRTRLNEGPSTRTIMYAAETDDQRQHAYMYKVGGRRARVSAA